jgi:hypothetical protein
MMENVCDQLENMEKYRNKASISTQKIRVDPKSNNVCRAESPRWPDYEDFEEDVDDFWWWRF